jgi:hypothetical protein
MHLTDDGLGYFDEKDMPAVQEWVNRHRIAIAWISLDAKAGVLDTLLGLEGWEKNPVVQLTRAQHERLLRQVSVPAGGGE